MLPVFAVGRAFLRGIRALTSSTFENSTGCRPFFPSLVRLFAGVLSRFRQHKKTAQNAVNFVLSFVRLFADFLRSFRQPLKAAQNAALFFLSLVRCFAGVLS